MQKRKVSDIQQLKKQGKKITALTAYDYGLAKILDNALIDIILVGDSMGNVFYGKQTTLEVSMDMVIHHTQAVATGAKNYSMVIADMPFGSFGISKDQTVANAVKLMKIGHAEAVKLEGASKQRLTEIKAIIDVGIPVLGHIGLLPQSLHKIGGYRVQGKETSFYDETELIKEAEALQKAGCFAIILEAMKAETAKKITKKIDIPTIGIGAGNACDGQILVSYDMLGYLSGHKPKFVKQYAHLQETIKSAIEKYIKEVKDGSFPSKEYSYED
ncbi:MAG: 3-methyl-2-oxobutanoate hydroxymethyltransferase [Asgard group archaeon]|nr:3-methyl-2-oxobutanoate hydroxymethyltransferase [Asgard group archaeon]